MLHYNERISQLSEAIQGTDEDVWPEVVADYRQQRQQCAFVRVNLLNKLAKEQ